MYTKAQIFNLALGALLLQRRITDTETDNTNECRVLNTHWDAAFALALQEMDLDSTSTQVTLELLEDMSESTDPTKQWNYGYQYPTDCMFLRRIQSTAIIDDRYSHIPKRVMIYMGERMIMTNQVEAVAEYISNEIEIDHLSAPAGMAVAYKLASMSAPLVVGKGSAKLIESIEKKYVISKAEAQALDQRENFNFVDPSTESEFVRERTS
jgi:hypothetical protein